MRAGHLIGIAIVLGLIVAEIVIPLAIAFQFGRRTERRASEQAFAEDVARLIDEEREDAKTWPTR